MFERLTDEARRVVVLAQQEARQMRHVYVGTEHLLLGLVREEGGVAGQVLAGLGLTLGPMRDQVAQRVGLGREPSPPSLPFTPRAKKTLEFALREALHLGHHHIGTEHILLGIVRSRESSAALLMAGQGAGPEVVRERVIQAMPEAGARPRARAASAPADLSRILAALADVGRAKAAAVEAQDFKRVAALSEQEQSLIAEKLATEQATDPPSTVE